MGKDLNDKFRDCIDKINNIAKSKGWRNGKDWAAFAVKFDLISTSMKIEYDRCHDLRNTMSHGNAKSIIVHQDTYSTAREFLRIIEAKIRENRRNRKIQKFNNTINDKKEISEAITGFQRPLYSDAEEAYLKDLLEDIYSEYGLQWLLEPDKKGYLVRDRYDYKDRDIAVLTKYVLDSAEPIHKSKKWLYILKDKLDDRYKYLHDLEASKYYEILCQFLP